MTTTRAPASRRIRAAPVDLDAELALLDVERDGTGGAAGPPSDRDPLATGATDDRSTDQRAIDHGSTDGLLAGDAPDGRRLRVRRSLVWATVGTGIALAAHVGGGGAQLPDWQGVLAPWVASAWLAVLLAGRALSLLRLTVVVGAAQFFFHTLFMLGSGSGGQGHAHHAHGATLPVPASAPGLPDGMSAHLAHSGPEMMLWHGIGAVATIALLHRGERTLAQLREVLDEPADRLAGRLLLPPIAVVPARRTIEPPPPRTDALAASRVFPDTVRRRGPPLVLAA